MISLKSTIIEDSLTGTKRVTHLLERELIR
jgi:hypothetical protein